MNNKDLSTIIDDVKLNIRVGAIIEYQNKILLEKNKNLLYNKWEMTKKILHFNQISNSARFCVRGFYYAYWPLMVLWVWLALAP